LTTERRATTRNSLELFFFSFYIVVLVLIVSLDPRGMRHDEDNFGEKPESQKLETVCHPL